MDSPNQRHSPNGKYMKTYGQIETLKEAFDRGESLTVAEALTRYGIYALSQRVGQLSKVYPIDREMVTLPSGKRVARYQKLRVAYG